MQLANEKLVLVNADFPRSSKNQLPQQQQDINDAIADKYNNAGIFPYTLLLDAQGNILQKWEGYPKATPEEFTDQLKAIIDAHK